MSSKVARFSPERSGNPVPVAARGLLRSTPPTGLPGGGGAISALDAGVPAESEEPPAGQAPRRTADMGVEIETITPGDGKAAARRGNVCVCVFIPAAETPRCIKAPVWFLHRKDFPQKRTDLRGALCW